MRREHLADLAARVDALRAPLTGWEFRQGRHIAPGNYEYGPWRFISFWRF